jgi:hypothetical protein
MVVTSTLQLLDRDPQRTSCAECICERPLDQFLGDQRRPSICTSVLVAVRARELPDDHVVRVCAHEQNEGQLWIVGGTSLEVADEEQPRGSHAGNHVTAVRDRQARVVAECSVGDTVMVLERAAA